MHPGRTAGEMAEVRTHRGPYSDPRDGRLHRQIRLAFYSVQGVAGWRPESVPDVVTTRYLVGFCYPNEYYAGKIRRWHRQNVVKVARTVAIPTRRKGRGAGRGRGYIWTPTDALELRSWRGKADRQRKRRGLSPLDF
jgi:hypothetical protein